MKSIFLFIFKERRILKEKGKATAYMGTKAIKELLKKTNTAPDEIDFLIYFEPYRYKYDFIYAFFKYNKGHFIIPNSLPDFVKQI